MGRGYIKIWILAFKYSNIILLGLKACRLRFESLFPLSSKGFIFKSSPTSKGEGSEILNVALMLYSLGRFNLYTLSLILARTWNGPSPLGCSLDRLWAGNLSFLITPKPNHLVQRVLVDGLYWLWLHIAHCSFLYVAVHFHEVSSPS